MGAVGDKARQFGRYIDPSTKAGRQHMFLGPFGPDGFIGKQFKPPTPPDVGAPPPPPDLTDKAVQEARRKEKFRTGTGSRRNSFITGPLGDATSIPVLGKSIITGG